jgi:hypothetical protein
MQWLPLPARDHCALQLVLLSGFNLSFRDIQEMMLERVVEVSHEAGSFVLEDRARGLRQI